MYRIEPDAAVTYGDAVESCGVFNLLDAVEAACCAATLDVRDPCVQSAHTIKAQSHTLHQRQSRATRCTSAATSRKAAEDWRTRHGTVVEEVEEVVALVAHLLALRAAVGAQQVAQVHRVDRRARLLVQLQQQQPRQHRSPPQAATLPHLLPPTVYSHILT